MTQTDTQKEKIYKRKAKQYIDQRRTGIYSKEEQKKNIHTEREELQKGLKKYRHTEKEGYTNDRVIQTDIQKERASTKNGKKYRRTERVYIGGRAAAESAPDDIFAH